MAILNDAGLVACRKAGRWVNYRLSDGISPSLRRWLEEALSGLEGTRLDRETARRILACAPRTLCRCPGTEGRAGQPAAGGPLDGRHEREESKR